MPDVRLAFVAGLGALTACRDLSNFSTHGDHFEGQVVEADFVRAGVDPGTVLCLTLDANHFQDGPGAVSSSDGRFADVALRPIPQIWHDPLSTLSFGDGRLKNLVYVAGATASFGDTGGSDVFVVMSLMQSGDVEVRLIRGAPELAAGDAVAPVTTTSVFAVFDLSRKAGACSF